MVGDAGRAGGRGSGAPHPPRLCLLGSLLRSTASDGTNGGHSFRCRTRDHSVRELARGIVRLPLKSWRPAETTADCAASEPPQAVHRPVRQTATVAHSTPGATGQTQNAVVVERGPVCPSPSRQRRTRSQRLSLARQRSSAVAGVALEQVQAGGHRQTLTAGGRADDDPPLLPVSLDPFRPRHGVSLFPPFAVALASISFVGAAAVRPAKRSTCDRFPRP